MRRAPPPRGKGRADIPDHVDYMTFRASTKETMKPGWVNPLIANGK